MHKSISRRDFLKLGGLSLAGLALRTFEPNASGFEDADVVRVATNSWSVYSSPSLDSAITSTWYRDDLIHVYKEVTAPPPTPEPGETAKHHPNPVWYRVWGGYMWRARLQRVRTIYNTPLTTIPEAGIPGGRGVLAEVTVPWTNPWRFSRAFGWEQLAWRLYYQSVHWVDAVDDGPPDAAYKGAWYRIWDHIASFAYFVPAMHLRPILPVAYAPISPDVPWDKKRIDVNLTAQTLTAYEFENVVFKTTISSGIPTSDTTTHVGRFSVTEKLPSEHMGEANIYQAVDDYVLAGVPWTCYFTGDGQAFHGTYWHENFGSPMSHGCINMRVNEALWLYRWATPEHLDNSYTTKPGRGTAVEVHF
ncbi:MAG TPA: L,D-transpeptidase [Anaerolineales bacterium]